ncbi:hypothetical protein POTOM_038133 [Populus tomentosa]|uniref:RING-type domain-containing protein n=1 Tax=Populus tomentosa TaxID=118781 RepID=A0A8X7YQS0_POPTO|nr:hypothetical protein POTOM_038133 [Populus tomentosa]
MKMSIRSVEYATLRTSVDTYESSCYWFPDLAFHALGGNITCGAGSGRYFAVTSNAQDYFGFLHNGSSNHCYSGGGQSMKVVGRSGLKFIGLEVQGLEMNSLKPHLTYSEWHHKRDTLYDNLLKSVTVWLPGLVVNNVYGGGWVALGGFPIPDPTTTTGIAASSALPFAKVLKAPPSYQFRFDQMSTDIRSQALFDHGKLAGPNVSHELPALRLQALLIEQMEITEFSQKYQRLQLDKILCRICFKGLINVVLLPCRHRALSSTCCQKSKSCPLCLVTNEVQLSVYDV